VLSVTINVPAAGSILVEANSNVVVEHASTSTQEVLNAYVTNAASCGGFIGSVIMPAAATAGLYGSFLGGRAVFDVPAGGSYTYHLRMNMGIGASSLDHAESGGATTLVAQWFPS
jgi:hypothetical protein